MALITVASEAGDILLSLQVGHEDVMGGRLSEEVDAQIAEAIMSYPGTDEAESQP